MSEVFVFSECILVRPSVCVEGGDLKISLLIVRIWWTGPGRLSSAAANVVFNFQSTS